MADEKLLRQILFQRYGITTAGELREAIERMEKLNICWATRCGRDDTGSKKVRRRAGRQNP